MNEEKFLLSSAEGDIDEDEGMTRLDIATMLAGELGMRLGPEDPDFLPELTGEALYQMYAKINGTHANTLVEDWENIPDTDQVVWNSMAEKLQVKP